MRHQLHGRNVHKDVESDTWIDVESVEEPKRSKSTKLKIKCAHCGYATCEAKHMRSHLLAKHFAIRRYRCRRGCKRSFLSKSVLQRHVKMVHKETTKALKCGDCSFATSRSHLMKKHRSFVHSPGNVWTCSFCAFSAATEELLNEHANKTHVDTLKNCVCGVCGFRSTSEGKIKMHIIKNHFAGFRFDSKRRKENRKT